MSQIQVPKGWKEVSFENISKKEKYSIKRGPWGSSITKSFFVPDGYKVYQQHNVIYNDFEYGNYFLDEKKFNELKDFEVKSGDFLISCSGTIGKVARVPQNSKKGVMNQALLKISADESKIDSDFFLYLLNSPILQKKILSKGSAMKNIVSVTNLKKIQFFIPETIELQKKIAHKLDYVLEQFEEKKKEILEIENKSKQIREYVNEKMKLFLISKIIKKSENSKYDLLSNHLQESEKRNPKIEPHKEFKYVEISSINTDEKKIDDYKIVLGSDAPSRARNVIRINDVIYATTRPYYRNIALIEKDLNNQVCTTGFCVLRVKDESILIPKFLYYFLMSNQANDQILKNMRGGNYPAVSDKDVKNIQIPKLDAKKQTSIIQEIEKTLPHLQELTSKINSFDKLRKKELNDIEKLPASILNQAFSGKLIN